jgi:hypothetical protein
VVVSAYNQHWNDRGTVVGTAGKICLNRNCLKEDTGQNQWLVLGRWLRSGFLIIRPPLIFNFTINKESSLRTGASEFTVGTADMRFFEVAKVDTDVYDGDNWLKRRPQQLLLQQQVRQLLRHRADGTKLARTSVTI